MLSIPEIINRQCQTETREYHLGFMKLTGEKRSTREKTPTHWNFAHHKYPMDWAGIESDPPRWEAGD